LTIVEKYDIVKNVVINFTLSLQNYIILRTTMSYSPETAINLNTLSENYSPKIESSSFTDITEILNSFTTEPKPTLASCVRALKEMSKIDGCNQTKLNEFRLAFPEVYAALLEFSKKQHSPLNENGWRPNSKLDQKSKQFDIKKANNQSISKALVLIDSLNGKYKNSSVEQNIGTLFGYIKNYLSNPNNRFLAIDNTTILEERKNECADLAKDLKTLAEELTIGQYNTQNKIKVKMLIEALNKNIKALS
jgi:hypothetical protein